MKALKYRFQKTDISRWYSGVIERPFHPQIVTRLFGRFSIVGLQGTRHVGMTTLAAAIARKFKGEVARFDLEDPAAVARLADPMLAPGRASRPRDAR